MYSWGDDTSDWAKPGSYHYDAGTAAAREAARRAVAARGGRSYAKADRPDTQRTDPTKHISTDSTTPVIVAVDVTGSMQRWPFEIFDRLPLLYQTLSQYRPDLELSFIAVGDGAVDR